MKRYCSAPNCEAEFDTLALVKVCPDCARGEDAWRHWFAMNDPRFVSNDTTRRMFDHTGRIRRDYWDSVHTIIDDELEGIVNFKNIDQAAKLHLQRQQEAAENLARQQQQAAEQAIAAREFVADHWLVDRLQAGQKKSVIQRLAAFFHF